MSDFWRQWEDQVVDGRFPLRRFLGESSHSAVFLTEHKAQRADAAIKFIRDDPSVADMQLERWRAAAALSHPHLIRLFETGHCRLGNHELLFVVMEYAEQTLAEILALRALTFDEVREMSSPALAALSFLHRNGWVHGQVKPQNICVVSDKLRLASDTLRPAGDPLAGSMDPTPFNAPEERGGDASAAGDIWGIGMTLVAALNKYPVPPPDGSSQSVFMPSTVPPAFADAVRRCLSPDVARRPTAADLQVQLTVAHPDPPALRPRSNVEVEPPLTPSAETSRSGVSRLRLVAGIILLLGVIWGGVRLIHGGAGPGPPRMNPASSTSGPASAPEAYRAGTEPAVSTDPVLHEEIPGVPRGALRSVRGRIQVLVTVTVDASGHVIDETLEHSGSSKYFSRAAYAAARKWRFAPAAEPGTRKWLLRFEFTRTGAAANAAPAS